MRTARSALVLATGNRSSARVRRQRTAPVIRARPPARVAIQRSAAPGKPVSRPGCWAPATRSTSSVSTRPGRAPCSLWRPTVATPPRSQAPSRGSRERSAFTAAGSNNGATNVFDVGANYFVAPDLVLIASVLQSRYSFVGTSTQGRLTQYNVGVDYVLSKRTDVYSYFANLRASNMYNPGVIGGAPGADMMQSAMTIGLRHKF